MGDFEKLPGPDPSSLQAVDHQPAEFMPLSLSVTYSSDHTSDYIRVRRSGRNCILELADPLFGLIRKAGQVKNFYEELKSLLTAIGVSGIVEHFQSTVARYTNSLLPVDAIPESITVGVAAYLITKMYEADILMLGYILQASIEELPNWVGLVEEAKSHPQLDVT